MIVKCESCQTGFTLDDRLIKSTGSKVRCSKCAHVFKVFPLETAPPKEMAQTPETLESKSEPAPKPVEQLEGKSDSSAMVADLATGEAQTVEEASQQPSDISGATDLEQLFQEITSDKNLGRDSLPEAMEEEKPSGLEQEKAPDSDIDDSAMADLDRFLSMDAPLDSPETDVNIEPVEIKEISDAGTPPQEIKGTDVISDTLQFEDLDLKLEPDVETNEAAEDDLQLGLDLDLKVDSGTEISAELSRSGEKGEEIDLADIDLSELDLFFEGKGSVASKGQDGAEALVAGLDAPEGSVGGQGDMVFDLADLELELESAGVGSSSSRPSSTPSFKGGDSRSAKESDLLEPVDGGIDLDELERMITESTEDVIPAGVSAGTLSAAAGGALLGQAAQSAGVLSAPNRTDDWKEAAGTAEAESRSEISGPKSAKVVPPKAPKAKSRLPLLWALLLLLLAAGAYLIAQFGGAFGIHIPFLDALKTAPPDPAGTLHIQTSGEPETKFIENQKEGRLFVISGKVVNHYKEPRGMIRIKADLVTTGQVVAQTKAVSCGNVLTDVDLSTLDMNAISKRLENKFGDNKSNIKVDPGKSLPFMIVFSKLPEKLEEFALEVVGSNPVN